MPAAQLKQQEKQCRRVSESCYQIRNREKISKGPPTVRRRNLKTEVWLWKDVKCFPSTLRRRNLKTQQSPAILCLRKTRSGKSRDYRDVIVSLLAEALFLLFADGNTKKRASASRERHRFRKAPFSKCCPSTSKRKAGSFQSPPLWRAFSKSSVFVTDQCGR